MTDRDSNDYWKPPTYKTGKEAIAEMRERLKRAWPDQQKAEEER